jgi:hypothetical protein
LLNIAAVATSKQHSSPLLAAAMISSNEAASAPAPVVMTEESVEDSQTRMDNRQPRQIHPGAVAVPGPGMDDDASSQDEELTISTPASVGTRSIYPVTARLVDNTEEDYEQLRQQNEELRQQNEELERIRRERENVAIAQVISSSDEEAPNPDNDDSPLPRTTDSDTQEPMPMTKQSTSFTCSHRKKQIAAIVAVILVILCIVLGVALPRTLKSTTTEPPPNAESPTGPLNPTTIPMTTPLTQQDLIDLLSSASIDGGATLQTPSTPQNNALIWLADNTKLNTYSDSQKIQRYVLATLYYSTNGEKWNDNTDWLSNKDECSWYNTAFLQFCINGAVAELALWSNNLHGTIPKELAMLFSSLNGEFVVMVWLFIRLETRCSLMLFAFSILQLNCILTATA